MPEGSKDMNDPEDPDQSPNLEDLDDPNAPKGSKDMYDPDGVTDVPNTGNNTRLSFWFSVMILSLIASIATMYPLRKRGKRQK